MDILIENIGTIAFEYGVAEIQYVTDDPTEGVEGNLERKKKIFHARSKEYEELIRVTKESIKSANAVPLENYVKSLKLTKVKKNSW